MFGKKRFRVSSGGFLVKGLWWVTALSGIRLYDRL
jgi:hypothetical protein